MGKNKSDFNIVEIYMLHIYPPIKFQQSKLQQQQNVDADNFFCAHHRHSSILFGQKIEL